LGRVVRQRARERAKARQQLNELGLKAAGAFIAFLPSAVSSFPNKSRKRSGTGSLATSPKAKRRFRVMSAL
jgi:hypothetical protein